MKRAKSVLSILLALAMMLSILPLTVYAATQDEAPAGADSELAQTGDLYIGTQPLNRLLDATVSNATAKLYVYVAGGLAPYTYQWYKVSGSSKTPISGATNAEYYTGVGEYFCIITDSSGAKVTSQNAVIKKIAGTSGSGESEYKPLMVNTFAQLKEALEFKTTLYIKVSSFTNTTNLSYYGLRAGTDYQAGSSAIMQSGEKYLTIDADIDIRANSTTALLYSFISCFGKLTVQGTGNLNVSFNSTAYPNSIIIVYSPGELTVNGGVTFDPSSAGVSTYGYSISTYTGMTTINGGTFKGWGKKFNSGQTANAYAVYSDSSTVGSTYINGGTFSSKNGDFNYGYGTLSSKSYLTGGTFYGINNKVSGKTLNDLIETDTYCYKNFETGAAVSGTVSSTTLPVRVEEKNVIYDVALKTDEILPGGTPGKVTPVSSDAHYSVTRYKWIDIEQAKEAVKFEQGHRYRLEFIVQTKDGYTIPANPNSSTNVTVNGKPAKRESTGITGGVGYLNCSIELPCLISLVDVVVDATAPGSAAAVTTAGCYITNTEWNYYDENVYKVFVRICSTDRAFSTKSDTKVVYTNVTDGTTSNAVIDYINEEYITCWAIVKVVTYVDKAAITITEPKAGSKPDFTVKKDTEACDFYVGIGLLSPNGTGLEFIDHSKGEPDTALTDIQYYMTKDDTFKEGGKYTARIFLSTMDKPGATYFAKGFTAKINGKNANIMVDTSSGKQTLIWVDYTFTVGSGGYWIGDVNADGAVKNRDALILDRYIAGWKDYDKQIKNWDAADMNRDGQIKNRDALMLDRYIAGWKDYQKYVFQVNG